LKIDENGFEGENCHDEIRDKKCFACIYSSKQYLLIVNCFSKYNKFGLTINYKWLPDSTVSEVPKFI
jgi:hypothetical protein